MIIKITNIHGDVSVNEIPNESKVGTRQVYNHVEGDLRVNLPMGDYATLYIDSVDGDINFFAPYTYFKEVLTNNVGGDINIRTKETPYDDRHFSMSEPRHKSGLFKNAREIYRNDSPFDENAIEEFKDVKDDDDWPDFDSESEKY